MGLFSKKSEEEKKPNYYKNKKNKTKYQKSKLLTNPLK